LRLLFPLDGASAEVNRPRGAAAVHAVAPSRAD